MSSLISPPPARNPVGQHVACDGECAEPCALEHLVGKLGPYASPARPSCGLPTAQEAAVGLQVQELAALVRARDWRQLARRAAAGYALSEAAVRMLATSRNREARGLVARRQDLPDDVLDKLRRDRSADVRADAEYLLWRRGPFTRLPAGSAAEVLHPSCPVELLLFHATQSGPWARDRALRHPNLPASERRRFAGDGDQTALRAVGGNSAVTPGEYLELKAALPPAQASQLRVGYLGNPSGAPGILRSAVAESPRLSPCETRSLAGNPSAPADVLRAVWGPSTSPAELVSNPACPADVLAAICTAHPNADWAQSQALVHPNADDDVRAAVRTPKVHRDALLTALGRDCATSVQVWSAAKLVAEWTRSYPLLLAVTAGIAA